VAIEERSFCPATNPQLESHGAAGFRGLELLEEASDQLQRELAGRTAAPSLAPKRQLKKLSVLVPIYNERWTVADVIRAVAAIQLPVEREIVAIDDGSTDGSGDVVEGLMGEIPELRLIRQVRNGGKGAAIRRGIEAMTGELAVIQDADLEYNPADLPRLIQPLLENQADAVFGSRFAGSVRRCLPFWHGQINRTLTLLSNMISGVQLTDMETGYKVVRADILRQLRLRGRSFTLEPELVARLAQWGARMMEVPIDYQGRSPEEGKKIRPRDGLKAIGTMLRCRFTDPQFSHRANDAAIRSLRHTRHYHRWMHETVTPYLGNRLLHVGVGIGSLSARLLRREKLVMVADDPLGAARLEARFARRGNVAIEHGDLTDRALIARLQQERVDSILATNLLQHVRADFLLLRNFEKLLQPGGTCVIFAAASPSLMNRMDLALGHHRRYDPLRLSQWMVRAGFEILHQQSFNRLGGLGWYVQGSLLGRCAFGSLQTRLFDRLWPLARHLDRSLPAPPMTTMIVARKPF